MLQKEQNIITSSKVNAEVFFALQANHHYGGCQFLQNQYTVDLFFMITRKLKKIDTNFTLSLGFLAAVVLDSFALFAPAMAMPVITYFCLITPTRTSTISFGRLERNILELKPIAAQVHIIECTSSREPLQYVTLTANFVKHLEYHPSSCNWS